MKETTMSLPPLNRPTPPSPLPRLASKTAPPKTQREPEVLKITFKEDEQDKEALKISFEGSGFDVTNEDIILDLIRLAANSYGYDLVDTL